MQFCLGTVHTVCCLWDNQHPPPSSPPPSLPLADTGQLLSTPIFSSFWTSSPCCSVCPDNWDKGRSGPRCGAYTLWRESTYLSSPNCWLDVAGHLKIRSHIWERAALCLPGVLNEGVEQNPVLYRHTNILQCCGVRNVHSATSPGPEGLCIPAPNTGFVDSYPSFIPLLLSKCQVSYNWDGLWVQKKIWHKKIPVLRGFSLSGGGGGTKAIQVNQHIKLLRVFLRFMKK